MNIFYYNSKMADKYTLKLLPFYTLSYHELLLVFQTSKQRIEHLSSKNKFKDTLIKSHVHKLIEKQKCKYYTESELWEVLNQSSFDITLMNLNIRSLNKNYTQFAAMLQTLENKIDIITLTEIGSTNIESRFVSIADRYNIEFKIPSKN